MVVVAAENLVAAGQIVDQDVVDLQEQCSSERTAVHLLEADQAG